VCLSHHYHLLMRCESGRFSLAIDRCASTSYFSFAQEVEEIRPRFFPPTAQEYIHLSIYLPTYLPINLPIYLPTYLPTYLPSYPTTYVSIRRNIQFGLMPQSVTPWSCFHTKQRNPSLVVLSSSSSIFPPFALARAQAIPPFSFPPSFDRSFG